MIDWKGRSNVVLKRRSVEGGGDTKTNQLFPMVSISRPRSSRCSSVKELMKPFKLNGMEFKVLVFETTAAVDPTTLVFFADEPPSMSMRVRCLFSGFGTAFSCAGTLSGTEVLAEAAFTSVFSTLGSVVGSSVLAGRLMRSS